MELHLNRQLARNIHSLSGTTAARKGVCFSGCKFTRLYFINVKMAGLVINGRELGHSKLWEHMKYDTAIKRTWRCSLCWQASTHRPPPRRGQPPPARREQWGKQMPRGAPQASTVPRLDATRDIFNIHKGGGNHCLPDDSLPLIYLLSIVLQESGKTDFFFILRRFPLCMYLESIFHWFFIVTIS